MIFHCTGLILFPPSPFFYMLGCILTQLWQQDFANMGVLYLVNFVDGKKMKMPESFQVCQLLVQLLNLRGPFSLNCLFVESSCLLFSVWFIQWHFLITTILTVIPASLNRVGLLL